MQKLMKHLGFKIDLTPSNISGKKIHVMSLTPELFAASK